MTDTANNGALTQILLYRSRLLHNLNLLREAAGGTHVWPVIKGNAYGHGATEIARILLEAGVDTLCVATPLEAERLAAQGLRARYIILSPMLGSEAALIIRRGFEVVVSNASQLALLSEAATAAGKTLRVHVLLDTGMARAGVSAEDFARFLQACSDTASLQVVGVMSHFACADEPENAFNACQLATFEAVRKAHLHHAGLQWHLANSAALLALPGTLFDAVRPGIALYGLTPFTPSAAAGTLHPVLEWHSTITDLEELPPGTSVSYGRRFITRQQTLVATVPVGYGDGLPRALSGRMQMLVGGRRCDQIGTITMDQCMLDVTALRATIREGDRVVIIGAQGSERISADELAALADTINYEIVTGLAERVPRCVVG